MRLDPQPGEVIDRSERLRFTWNGRPFEGYAGDTIASALAAAGVRVLSRSLKYHRPRGLLTASFHDPGSLVQVGDEPNVRAAHRLLADGMDVRAQNAWPSLGFDVKATNDRIGRFLPAGFYYKTFMRPRRLWPAYERVLRRFAPGGPVPRAAGPSPNPPKRFAHPDVLVVGGGPAGMAAAIAAGATGARVLLVEEEHQLGGHLRWGSKTDLVALDQLRTDLAATASVETLTDAVAIGRYDDNWVGIVHRAPDGGERLVKARARVLVVATGLIERPYVIAGNDLPGVLLSTAVRRLVNLYAVRPGERAVVLTANSDGDAAIADLERIGVDVAHVEDARLGGDVVRVLGRRGHRGVRGVELPDGSRVDCDLVVTATGWTASTALLDMAGAQELSGTFGPGGQHVPDNSVCFWDPVAARFRPDPDRLPDSVLTAGGVLGDGATEDLVDHGTAVGEEAARRATATLSAHISARTRIGADNSSESARRAPVLGVEDHVELFQGRTHGIVDLAEDVSSHDLATAVEEGYRSIELAKRYTTATMGPTQGKLEAVNTGAIVAGVRGRTLEEIGRTTSRPPYAPVTLGALAGPHREPLRRSPMQSWHEAHGARPLVAGQWIRPDHYGDAMAEARNVREAVGIIDVTPIGKLDLRGPDIPELLNLAYVNKWSKLPVGRVRYGVMCAEDGVVLDDGVVGRLDTDHYLMSTTSSGADRVAEWLELWLQTERPDWRVHVTPMTSAYASINVAGPRSRELMRRVVEDIDLAPDAFGYMAVRVGRVAGVDGCVVWRIGFTGELSYELHVPSGHGLHVWQSLLDRGKDLDVAPFGIEAQRILRLEKGHLIVGQDTDGLTRAHTAGLGGLVKLDKPDFVGRPELAWEAPSDHPRLVGLWPVDEAIVPDEGCQLLTADNRICGRITSSRRSPTLGRAICLAQVDADRAEPGTEVRVRLVDGRTAPAVVTEHLAAVDPEGSRLRG